MPRAKRRRKDSAEDEAAADGAEGDAAAVAAVGAGAAAEDGGGSDEPPAKRRRTDDNGGGGSGGPKGKEAEAEASTAADEAVVEGLDEAAVPALADRKREPAPGVQVCPYLDTVDRSMLDFDFEKLCSISLSNLHVYACLVCGKYFQGRGRSSHAYFHSLSESHHVFIHLENMKVYCLPDGYEVVDRSLDDIKAVLNPTFSPSDIARLDTNTKLSRGLDGSEYLPGVVGLNNIKQTDSINVIVQALAHVTPLRDFFLDENNYKHNPAVLVTAFGELMRKMWNPNNFKGHVSPHELVQAISKTSKKRFHPNEQADPIDILAFTLNSLHRGLGGKKKPGSSLIHQVFQGEVAVTVDKVEQPSAENMNREPQVLASNTTKSPFLFLSLEVPPAPLYQDEQNNIIIPQVPMYTILSKFDGSTPQELMGGGQRRVTITKLPPYLIFHVKRFTKNNFFVEKNPTIVNFPITNLELKDYCSFETEEEAAAAVTRYDLVANICHDGEPTPGKGTYRCHVRNRANNQWYEVEDLNVAETMPQMIAVTESYLQIFERQDIGAQNAGQAAQAKAKGKGKAPATDEATPMED